jgi:hypothetical protein
MDTSAPRHDRFREPRSLGDQSERWRYRAELQAKSEYGAVLAGAALGDTDTDPTLSHPSDVLFSECRHGFCDHPPRRQHSNQWLAATVHHFRFPIVPD